MLSVRMLAILFRFEAYEINPLLNPPTPIDRLLTRFAPLPSTNDQLPAATFMSAAERQFTRSNKFSTPFLVSSDTFSSLKGIDAAYVVKDDNQFNVESRCAVVDNLGLLLVRPRSVFYFEVAVKHSMQVSASSSNMAMTMSMNSDANGIGNASIGECIAVGIATQRFRANSKLPGWDR